MMIFLCLVPVGIIGMLSFIFLSVASSNRKREKLKPIQYLHYNRSEFNRIFEFKCEHCGQKISNREEICPYCGSSYRENPEYKEKKKAISLEYLKYLETQKSKIQEETEYIEKTIKTLRSNIIMKRTFFNFELGEKITYIPSEHYEFTCDFCGAKLLGRSDDQKTCSHCGADYKDNLDLKVQESEDQLDKLHYDEYIRLKKIEENQNRENAIKDAKTNKHGALYGLLIVLGMFAFIGLVAAAIIGISVIYAGGISSDDKDAVEESIAAEKEAENEKRDAANRTMIAEALGMEEDSRNINFIIEGLNTITVGQLQSAEVVEIDGEDVIDIITESDRRYRVYLSKSGSVEAVEDLDTGAWPIWSTK